MNILSGDAIDLDTLAAFIARLNTNSANHIGYFDTQPAEVAAALRAILPPISQGFRLAFDASQLVGVLGVEADTELGRAWLYGPLVDHANADEIADQLYAALLPAIPPQMHQQELFCDLHNQMCGVFAERHGFTLHSEAAALSLTRDRFEPQSITASTLQEPYFAAFRALHAQLFPSTYASAQQLIDRRSEHAQIFAAVKDGQLQGYVAAKVDPMLGTGYTDYVGVAAEARQKGIGRHLLVAAIQWMFSFPEVQRTDLTVNTSNAAALRLYTGLGFEQERVLRAYRKEVA